MTPEQKSWIDNASYDQLLEKWRFAPVGDPFFQGDTGEYYSDVMRQKRANSNHMRKSLEAVEAMKEAGLEFVPVPVMNDEDREKLIIIMANRLDKLGEDAGHEEAEA